MPIPSEIHVRLTPEKIEALCKELDRQSSSAGHALAALTGLQTCLVTMVPSGDHALPAYKEMMALIEQYAAAARARLLEENAVGLIVALRDRSRPEITRIHAALSRNGFMQVAQQALQNMLADEIIEVAAWAKNWCQDAASKAQAASGYPDALNFHAAGIQPKEYAAMKEINAYLANAVTFLA